VRARTCTCTLGHLGKNGGKEMEQPLRTLSKPWAQHPWGGICLPLFVCWFILIWHTRADGWGKGVDKSHCLVTHEWWACGMNQPCHFGIVARVMKRHVSAVHQSEGTAVYHCSLFLSVQGSLHYGHGLRHCRYCRWWETPHWPWNDGLAFLFSPEMVCILAQWFKDQQIDLETNKITNILLC
jgi:hypothetical protein